METLDQIALKYGTDKSSKAHFYTQYYESYFEDVRNEKLNILEIGIQNGCSLKMWKEYFTHAEIYGMDIVDCSHMQEERVHILHGSQNDAGYLKTLPQFDIIIDDGSHQSRDMRVSFDTLFPLLKPGGLYIVEDLHCCYWDEFKEGNFMERIKELLDLTNANGISGYAYKENDDPKVEYSWWQENIEFVHLYRSIVFIKKR